MISLARQLALRREIEEQFADLAGRLGRRDGERLSCGGKWRGRTDAERARDSASARLRALQNRRPCACGAPRPKHATFCRACRKQRKAARTRAAWRRAHPLDGGCVDCGGARHHRGSPRCRTCRAAHRQRRSMLWAIAKDKAARAADRAAIRCLDCHDPIPDAQSTNRKRCKPCRAKHKCRLVCERGRRMRARKREAQQQQQRRAA